ncbi:MAG: hypothetical protein WC682_01010 [Parcubacteria group bacterium]|jgi:hypothetical protein
MKNQTKITEITKAGSGIVNFKRSSQLLEKKDGEILCPVCKKEKVFSTNNNFFSSCPECIFIRRERLLKNFVGELSCEQKIYFMEYEIAEMIYVGDLISGNGNLTVKEERAAWREKISLLKKRRAVRNNNFSQKLSLNQRNLFNMYLIAENERVDFLTAYTAMED